MTQPRRQLGEHVEGVLHSLADRAERFPRPLEMGRRFVHWLGGFVNPRVRQSLVSRERVIDEVPHHWIVHVIPGSIMLFALLLALFWLPRTEVKLIWVPVTMVVAIFAFGAYRSLFQHLDRFVITNIRVFRVWGVFLQRRASMPTSRLLDVTVRKPFTGRIFGWGHIVLETAAQEQGIREIRFIPHPDQRDRIIQEVRTGLEAQAAKPGRHSHPHRPYRTATGPVRVSTVSEHGAQPTQPPHV